MENHTDCEASISAILEALEADFLLPERMLNAMTTARQKLKELPEQCNQHFVSMGEALLSRREWRWQDEQEFETIVIVAVERKVPGVWRLLSRAILEPKTSTKEDYVELLGDTRDPQAIPALVHVIQSSDYSGSEMLLSKAIDSLRLLRSESAATFVVPMIRHPLDRVRSSAISFVAALGISAAAPVLAAQVPFEDDAVVLDKLLDVLVAWSYCDALPILKAQLDAGSYSGNSEAEESVRSAVEALERIAATRGV